MIKNINIFGSNFGSLVHLEAVKKISKFLNILICSPNIHKKKINLCKSKKFNNYQETLKSNPDAVGIATQPKIQSKICKYIIKNKINSIKYILLEKPIAQNFKEVKSIIKGLKKRKINFLVNFIFENNLILKKHFFF